ncbi:MAG: molybdenum cofactor guanylyltransferase [Deltaproteobacteria bacterium]|nr:MAG: molybdenum cofactor guanylyltransferase [Deltaproteobacteria bacterium]
MTGIILAGGKSTRLKQDKAFVEIGGKKVIEKIIYVLSSLFEENVIVIGYPDNTYENLGAKVVTDLIPGKDSLGGIYTGLHSSSYHHSFIVACDMPFINRELIKYLKSVVDDYDVVVPKVSSHFEPLHAIYSKGCLKHIEKLINEDNLRILDFYQQVRVRTVSDQEIRRFDPRMRSFFNVNTQNDLKEALAISQESKEENE